MDGVGDHDKCWYCHLLAISTPSVNEPPHVKPGARSATAVSGRVGETYVARHEFAYTAHKLVSLVSLIYMERHTFTQNKIQRDKNEIVWHRIVL
jgi:hypothetical protein